MASDIIERWKLCLPLLPFIIIIIIIIIIIKCAFI